MKTIYPDPEQMAWIVEATADALEKDMKGMTRGLAVSNGRISGPCGPLRPGEFAGYVMVGTRGRSVREILGRPRAPFTDPEPPASAGWDDALNIENLDTPEVMSAVHSATALELTRRGYAVVAA